MGFSYDVCASACPSAQICSRLSHDACAQDNCEFHFAQCGGCDVCKDHAAGDSCAFWCNSYTCKFSQCTGCSVCESCSHGGMYGQDAANLMRSYMAYNATPSTISLANQPNLKPIGYHTAHICEATDAAYSTAGAVDGQSGDMDYPFGTIKVLATVGEYDPTSGYMLVGVPDGMGAYLKDKDTVRIIYQSESYGPINWWCREVACGDSFPFIVNEATGASFTGSHVMYIDYNREALAHFMESGAPKAA